MIWILLIVIASIIWFLIDREKHLKKNENKYGGLRMKYSDIDNYLVQGANFSIAKDKRDCLHYVKTLTAVHYDCLLVEHLDGFEITWQQRTPFGTNHKTWKYSNNSYQQSALKNIELYMEELVS